MAHVMITGSTDGLGLMAARLLLDDGHDVTLHARSAARAGDVRREEPRAKAVLVGDLASMEETRAVADQANELGRFDAVIHNAGTGPRQPRRIETADGLSAVFQINVLAPYLLTALVTRPARLVYLTSGLHLGGEADLSDPQWEHRRWDDGQGYSDSKLYDTMLACAVARLWPGVLSNAVGPGWVATKMGGPGAPDDLSLAPVTQAWLAVSDDPAATVTGGYFYHQRPREPHPAARDAARQDALLAYCADLTGTPLPPGPR